MGIKVTDKRKFERDVDALGTVHLVLSERQVFADWTDEHYEEVRTRVEKGMAWLDEHEPNWFDRFAAHGFEIEEDEQGKHLDLALFDIRQDHVCVLGITFGSYNDACVKNGLTMNESAALGFCLRHNYDQDMATGDVIYDDDDLCDGYPPVAEVDDFVTWSDLQRMWTYKVEAELGIKHINSIVLDWVWAAE